MQQLIQEQSNELKEATNISESKLSKHFLFANFWEENFPHEFYVIEVQAVLDRTLTDYKAAGFDPQSSSLEIKLIQSREDIHNPTIAYFAEKCEQTH